MKTGLFRRTSVKHNDCGDIISAHYTDGRGIQFHLDIPEGEKYFHLGILVTNPFSLGKDDINLSVEDFDDALELAVYQIQELFDSVVATLNMTSEALMSQIGKDW